MTTLNLGADPLRLHVTLSAASDFVCEVTYKTSTGTTDWPVGTTLALVFETGQSWPATITGAVARFDVDKATTASIPAGLPVRLQYTNGTTDRALAIGVVKRND